jgi:GH25 family lysozyme M1 (1,4-beta-N-acetylmuramidase)
MKTRYVIVKAAWMLVMFFQFQVNAAVADTTPGIDLSEQNPVLNPYELKGIYWFAFVEVNKGMHADTAFERNCAGVRKVGIPLGAYLYARPLEDMHAQVSLFVSRVRAQGKGTRMLPPVLDLELPSEWKAAFASPDQRLAAIQKCLNEMQKGLGIRPIVYMSPSFVQEVLNGSAPVLANYPLWVARYATAPRLPTPWYKRGWLFWQNSGSRQIKGVACNSDGDSDYFNGSRWQLNGLTASIR